MGDRTVPWFVQISDDPMMIVTKENDHEAYLQEMQESGKTVKYGKYLVWSSSPGYAGAKAMAQFTDDHRDGQPLRLGQGMLYTVVVRTHKKEADKWQRKTLR